MSKELVQICNEQRNDTLGSGGPFPGEYICQLILSNSTSSSVRVTTELHEKHAHAYLVIAVLAIRSVNTCVNCTEQNLVLLQQRSLP